MNVVALVLDARHGAIRSRRVRVSDARLGRRFQYVCVLLSLAILALAPINTFGQVISPPTFTLIPAAPTNQDLIHLHVNTGQICSPRPDLFPNDVLSVQVSGSQVEVFLRASYCPNPPPLGYKYQFDVDVGPLLPGTYQIAIRLDSPPTNPPDDLLLGTQTFQVAAFQAAAIPTLEVGALVVLSLTLILLAAVNARRCRSDNAYFALVTWRSKLKTQAQPRRV